MDTEAPEITDFSVPDWGMPDDPSLEQLDADDEEASDDAEEDATGADAQDEE